MTALDAFYASAVAYDKANHALNWAWQHLPLLLVLAALAGLGAALWLHRTEATDEPVGWASNTASGDDWQLDTDAINAFHAHIDAAEDLETCQALWPDAPSWPREEDVL